MTRIDEQYIIKAANANEHNNNKAFIAARYPVGNPLGYIWIANDVQFTITLQRLNWAWVPPTQ